MSHERQVVVLALVGVLAAACGDAGSADGDGSGGATGSTSSGPGATTGTGGAPPIDTGCDGDATVHTGEATYYDFADGSGNCSFPATPNDLMVGAMNQTDYADSAVCGACADVVGPDGTTHVKIRIVDRCPECPQGNIDLSPEAFALLSPLDAGRIDITWTYVPCDVGGSIVFHFKDGSNPYWTAVQIRNHTYAIAKVEARMPPADYVELPRFDYNYFIAESGLGDGPYDFRVTDVNGNVIENGGIALAADSDVPGTGQFPVCAAN